MIVSDEHDRKWEVLATDPAWNLASGLKRRGYAEVSLPRSTIYNGSTPPVDSKNVAALARVYNTAGGDSRKAIGRAFLAACQLYDCCLGVRELGLVEEVEE